MRSIIENTIIDEMVFIYKYGMLKYSMHLYICYSLRSFSYHGWAKSGDGAAIRGAALYTGVAMAVWARSGAALTTGAAATTGTAP